MGSDLQLRSCAIRLCAEHWVSLLEVKPGGGSAHDRTSLRRVEFSSVWSRSKTSSSRLAASTRARPSARSRAASLWLMVSPWWMYLQRAQEKGPSKGHLVATYVCTIGLCWI